MYQEEITNSLNKVKAYIEKNNFKGYDPYDALKSPFFKLPVLKSNKLIRFSTQQLVKRLPFSIRPLLLVPKGLNPVTLGLCIQGYAYLYKADPENKNHYQKQIIQLIDELEKLIPNGFSGACWGYDFDWEARHAKIPGYQPTVVATGIITNALYIAYQIVGIEICRQLVISAAQFVMKDLKRTETEKGICFSYSPFDKQQVFNASMKGVRLLAQAYELSKDNSLIETAEKAVSFVMANQKSDGSWGYSLAKEGGWTDNYHTGYVLDCLDDYTKLSGNSKWINEIKLGYNYYLDHFILEEGMPKFYYNNPYPVDCTSASQTILTTVRFGNKEIAEKVAAWMRENMQKRNGSFYFRKFKKYTIKTSFMRWSQAWMFAALSYLIYEQK